MSDKAPHGWEEIKAFYGWDASLYEHDLEAWERQMVLVPAPAGERFTYNGRRASGVRVHPKIAHRLESVLREIRDDNLWHYLEATGGGYAFRAMRGANKLSMHSLGGAIDVDPARNALGVPPADTALGGGGGLRVVRIFEARGWTWGGRWLRPDAMHFQWASGY